MAKVLDRFSSQQVAKISGVGIRTLDFWALSGFLAPSVAKGTGPGSRRSYSFGDIVAARVARDLRVQRISLQKLRTIVKRLQNEHEHPLRETCLVVWGRDVVHQISKNQLISELSQPGQQYLLFSVVELGRVIEELKIRAKKVQAA